MRDTICAMLMLTVAARAGTCLVLDGQPRAAIVVGETPSAAASGAAAELALFLRRMSGAEVPVLPRAEPGQGALVLVGQDAASQTAGRLGLQIPAGQTPQFAEEGYVVYAGGDTILLAGNETEPYEGTWYAVYDLLETLGCRWYFPGTFGEVVPTLRTVTVPPQNRLVRPRLRVRDTWYSGHLAVTPAQAAEFAQWKRRNRMTRHGFWLHCGAEEARFLQNPVDDSTWRLLPRDKYWESHPEYYAMKPDGSRNDRFLCMSNPGALAAAVETVCEYFAARPGHHTFAFSPPDEPVLCHCPDCTRALSGRFGGEGWGDVSDPYFRFVFALADRVRERYPDRWITTMAYYNRCRPPQGVSGKHPNVLIQLASIQQCSLHSYLQKGCWTRRQFADMLRQWSELTAGQVFYEYDPHDWTHLQRPAWRSQGIADDLRLLESLGGWGFSNEGQMAWMSTGLNYWVRARLAWDLEADPEGLVQDFCERFFGPARRPMLRLYAGIERAIRESPAHSGGFPGRDDWQVILPRELLDRCEGWLGEAARQAPEEPFRSRVAAFRTYLDRMQAYIRSREALVRGEYAEAARQADLMADAVRQMGDSALLQDAGPWGGSRSGAGLAKAARDLAAWTEGPRGRRVAVLAPEAWFRTDPGSDGVVGRWYAERGNRGWRRLAMSGAWASQGVLTPEDRPYQGVAWYRCDLDLPAAPEGSPRLLIPELEGSEIWVWCNDAFAGYASAADDKPITVPLGGLLRSGRNRLAFRVMGAGGLCLPPVVILPADPGAFPDSRQELRVFPAQWLFRTDPSQAGDAEGWAREALDESAWRPIPVPAAWEKTPVGEYDGVAWYRVHFALPAEADPGRLLLQFGAVDEETWVYLNGEFQGEHTEASTGETVHQIWDKPFALRLKGARSGQDNVLAVKVRDSVGAGGIFRPVRLYQAP